MSDDVLRMIILIMKNSLELNRIITRWKPRKPIKMKRFPFSVLRPQNEICYLFFCSSHLHNGISKIDLGFAHPFLCFCCSYRSWLKKNKGYKTGKSIVKRKTNETKVSVKVNLMNKNLDGGHHTVARCQRVNAIATVVLIAHY